MACSENSLVWPVRWVDIGQKKGNCGSNWVGRGKGANSEGPRVPC